MKYLLDKETTRLLFRKIDLSDFDQWLPFFEDPQTHQHWITEPKPPSVHCEVWYRRQQQRYDENLGGMNALIEKSSGKLIGHAGLLIQRIDGQPALEIAYSLLPSFWGKGYATEAAMACRDHAFENNLADSVISIISITNTPSINVALRNKMKVDKETVYNENNVRIFRITRQEWERSR